MSFRLGSIPRASFWLHLPFDIRVCVRPLTTPVWQMALCFAQRALAEIAAGEEILDELGIERSLLPDLNDPDGREGVRQLLIAQCLGRAAIIKWNVVEGEAHAPRPAPVTPAAVNELMLVHSIADEFVSGYAARMLAMVSEGNASRPSPNGSSEEGLNTAGVVVPLKQPAPSDGAA